MSHKKPQRLLTIDQIVKRGFIQDVLLGSGIIFLIGAMAYLAFYQG